MSSYYSNYNNNAVTESDVTVGNLSSGDRSQDPNSIIMDIDDYNNELARKVKKPLDKKLRTYLPYYKTFEVYAAKHIPYSMPEGEKRVTNFVIESGELYSRTVTRIYKVRSPYNDNRLFIMWNEIRYGRTGIGNARQVTADNVGQYTEPIPDYAVQYDQRTEAQAVRIKGTKEVVTRYNLEFSQDLVNELLKDAEGGNPNSVQYVLILDTRPNEAMQVSYNDFINPDFDAVYSYHRDLITARRTGVMSNTPNPSASNNNMLGIGSNSNSSSNNNNKK